MKPVSDKNRLERLRRQFHSAKKRVKYWSGAPSFTGGFATTRLARERLAARGSDHEREYETALDDAVNLADQIQALSGKRPQILDIRKQNEPV
jgi:hypothetical protein